MKILVCGSRDWDDKEYIFNSLDSLNAKVPITQLAHGNARGVDRIAGAWAKLRQVPVVSFPVPESDWKAHPKTAGLIRNERMLESFKPELVVAFKRNFDHYMHKGGTEHMVRIANAEGVKVIMFPTIEEIWKESNGINSEH